MIIRIAAACLTAVASAAHAAVSGPTAIPEGSDVVLFSLAVAALVIGRQASKRPPGAK